MANTPSPDPDRKNVPRLLAIKGPHLCAVRSERCRSPAQSWCPHSLQPGAFECMLSRPRRTLLCAMPRMHAAEVGANALVPPLPLLSKDRTTAKESLWSLEVPVRKMILQMHTPARTSQCWSRQTQHGLGVCIWMPLVNGTGNSPPLPDSPSRVFKQDKSFQGSVDTTKTRSDPQRFRMCKGERPMGTAKGKQTNAMALYQSPSPRPVSKKQPHPAHISLGPGSLCYCLSGRTPVVSLLQTPSSLNFGLLAPC